MNHAQRQDNSHGSSEDIYVIDEISQDRWTSPAIITFQDKGKWSMSYWAAWKNPPYRGQQYQFVKQINKDKIVLKLPLSNLEFELERQN